MNKRIIINADDFGLSESANEAIVDLFLKKKISSATLMTNLGNCSRRALDLAKKYRIPIGLHFNLTLGRPLSDSAQTLIDKNGCFFSRKEFEKRISNISREQIINELTVQYDFITSQNITPTHIDSHQHIHNWPQIYPVVAEFASRKNIGLRRVKEPILLRSLFLLPKDIWQLLRKTISYVFALYNEITKKVSKNLVQNKNLYSFFALCPRPDIPEQSHYQYLLKKMKNKSELMVHPISREVNTQTSITHYSVAEYQILRTLDLGKIELINYSEL